jgi:hypothetical protein
MKPDLNKTIVPEPAPVRKGLGETQANDARQLVGRTPWSAADPLVGLLFW